MRSWNSLDEKKVTLQVNNSGKKAGMASDDHFSVPNDFSICKARCNTASRLIHETDFNTEKFIMQ